MMVWQIAAGFFFVLWIVWVFLWVRERGKQILLTERMVGIVAEADAEKKQAERSVITANELAVREKTRADQQFKVIEDATRETAAIWTLYRKQGIEAGNAQAYLFRELETVVRAYNGLAESSGKPYYQVPKQLRNILKMYREEHVDEEKAKKNRQALVDGEVNRVRGMIRDPGA